MPSSYPDSSSLLFQSFTLFLSLSFKEKKVTTLFRLGKEDKESNKEKMIQADSTPGLSWPKERIKTERGVLHKITHTDTSFSFHGPS